MLLLKARARKAKTKIFCIGLNKTGTTTIEYFFLDHGLKVGNQRAGENELENWSKRDFRELFKIVKAADAFQDIPFSLPYTYQVLDQYFPNSKFILTIRDYPEQWYKSITKFHSQLWGDGENPPSSIELKKAPYNYEGFAYDFIKLTFGTTDDALYKQDVLIQFYKDHISCVQNYFKHKPNQLITINVARQHDYHRLCEFLEVEPKSSGFRWLNKTNS